jgi:dTDP-4-dehydrorhamnose reductase
MAKLATMGILLLGGSGQVGTELLQQPWPEGAELLAPPRDRLDLENPQALAEAVASRRWDAVVNCAAFTAVDRAESERDRAFRVNAAAPEALAQATAAHGIPLIQVSTDYVFDGSKRAPYGENDKIAPINAYGESKAAGEHAVRRWNDRHLIVRTSWIFSAHGANFVKTMLRLGGTQASIGVVPDQIGCPTPAGDLAGALRDIVLALARGTGQTFGTFHLCGEGAVSRLGFAEAIFDEVRARGGKVPVLEAVKMQDYPTAARRPAYSCLDCSRIRESYGIAQRSWRPALNEVVGRLLSSRAI